LLVSKLLPLTTQLPEVLNLFSPLELVKKTFAKSIFDELGTTSADQVTLGLTNDGWASTTAPGISPTTLNARQKVFERRFTSMQVINTN
jgi:hypothetical protein